MQYYEIINFCTIKAESIIITSEVNFIKLTLFRNT